MRTTDPSGSPVVNDLARQTVTRINEAAALNPVNLLATVMLATDRLAMDERLLAQLMEDLCNPAPAALQRPSDLSGRQRRGLDRL